MGGIVEEPGMRILKSNTGLLLLEVDFPRPSHESSWQIVEIHVDPFPILQASRF